MSSKSTHTSRNAGFTLIEILVVIVILGILGAVVVPQLLSRPDTARVQAAQTDLRTLSAALDVYRLDNFNYPSSEQGLDALVTRPAGFPEPKNWNRKPEPETGTGNRNRKPEPEVSNL